MRGRTARELSETEVRELAVRYLGLREYGVEELKYKLRQRGAESGISGKVVDDLVENGLVSDLRFTEMYVRTRVRRMFGPIKIRGELRGRGIADSVIEESMPADAEIWVDMATQWLGKRHQGSELDYDERARIYRSLVNRGFTHEQANTALSRI